MHKPSLIAAAASSLLLAVAAQAAPAVPNDGQILNYAAPAEVLDDFHGGLQGFYAIRNVENYGRAAEIKAQRFDAYLGYDLTRWLTVYALGGVLSTKSNDLRMSSDTEFAYGAGLWAALVDDAQLDFLSTMARYRLNAGVEVSHSDPNDLGWTQVDASLTFEILNDSYIWDGTFPSAIGVFFGPVFSKVDMDGHDQVSDNEWGFTVGGELRFADGVYVSGGYDFFNDDSVGYFQAGVRF